jgi:Mrp family chromosome partitioning ATPase/capsular polysaccharide biosynthesis protein
VLLNDPRSSGGIASEIGLVLDPDRFVRNQAKVMESPQVAQRTADNIDGGFTAKDVQDATSASPARDLDALTVLSIMPTADGSVAMLNALVQAYEEIVTEQVQMAANSSIATLEASKVVAEARIAELEAQIAQDPENASLIAQQAGVIDQLVALDTRIELLTTNAVLYGSGVQLLVPPDTPESPIQPKPLRNGALAFFLAALAAGAWAWWRTLRHQLATDREMPAQVLQVPMLAEVPDFRYLKVKGPAPTVTDPSSGAAESYQFAVSSLRFALERIGGCSILITSASPGDGKTATALNLAVAATKDGRNPLLIDADERAQGLTILSGLQGKPGTSDLNGSGGVGDSTYLWSMVDGTSLDFVPAGTGSANTAGYFRSDGFRSGIGRLFADRDMVIVDAPPVMAAAETTDVASTVDAIVLVVAEGTPLRDLGDASERLSMSGTPIIGYIFNRSTPKPGATGYGYGYGYGYGNRAAE